MNMSACKTEFAIHPAADMFPILDGKDLAGIIASMQREGFRADKPIIVWRDQIIDGRNRLAASKIAGVEPAFKRVSDDADPYLEAWAHNGARRDLEPDTKAAIYIKMLAASDDWQKEREEARRAADEARASAARAQHEAAGGKRLEVAAGPVSRETAPTRPTDVRVQSMYEAEQDRKRDERRKQAAHHPNAERTKIAEAAGVSPATVARVQALQKAAPDKFDAVARGETKANAELNAIKFADAKAKASAAASAATIVPVVDLASATDWLATIAPQSADLLLTDPPYMTDVPDIHEFARSWVPLALSRIKPTGRAYICIGAYGEEMHAYLDVLRGQTDFTLANVLVWTYRNTIGPSPKLDYKQNWQAILYLRGPDAASLDCPIMLEQFTVQDINAPDGRLGDRFHAWQKPDALAERLVRHSTKPGAFVIDPFVCTGSFVLAAARLGREARGCDISESNLAIALQRGCRRGL